MACFEINEKLYVSSFYIYKYANVYVYIYNIYEYIYVLRDNLQVSL